MNWIAVPRYTANFIARNMLLVPDSWRPVISNVLTAAIWVDLALLILLALMCYAA